MIIFWPVLGPFAKFMHFFSDFWQISGNGHLIKSLCNSVLTIKLVSFFPLQHDEPHKDDEWCVQAKQLLLGFARKIELPNR